MCHLNDMHAEGYLQFTNICRPTIVLLLHEGHMTDGMFFIEHGRVDVRLTSGEVLERISEGGYFGGNGIRWTSIL